MRVSADLDRCIGSGQCAVLAPEVFDQDTRTGSVILLDPEPAATQLPAVQEAVATCPRLAIAVTDV